MALLRTLHAWITQAEQDFKPILVIGGVGMFLFGYGFLAIFALTVADTHSWGGKFLPSQG